MQPQPLTTASEAIPMAIYVHAQAQYVYTCIYIGKGCWAVN